MKAIIFIGTNKSGSGREAIIAAEKLGYLTMLFTNNEKQLQQRKVYPDIHKMIFIDTTNIEEMRAEIPNLSSIGLEIKTIVSFVDPFVHIASILCDEFCQNYTSSKAITMMEDKEETRNFLKNQPYSPKFFPIKPNESSTISNNFPLIVKSPKSTGSKDVLLAKNVSQLNKHFTFLQNKNPSESIMVEEYIEGRQYLVEALVYKRQAQIVAIIEQEITQGNRFIITGYGVLAEVPNDYKEVLRKCSILSLTNLTLKMVHCISKSV